MDDYRDYAALHFDDDDNIDTMVDYILEELDYYD